MGKEFRRRRKGGRIEAALPAGKAPWMQERRPDAKERFAHGRSAVKKHAAIPLFIEQGDGHGSGKKGMG
ncbi:hypothetical protein A5N86_08865 [Geobacillus thermoleovorans]|uniref:Uncharacterized protein n=4 Tax=Geobacillus TaxID=129337 RepID=A0A164CD39_GEOSE|nr:hypothetical protein BGM21_15280 [Geobacillus thermoleovorans]EQB96873.1 hypothetical protein GA8_03935 [Geobacillus sp. A8]ESU73054.1 hypothetical protein T260_05460 [Geobacillus sp. MAS1]KAF6509589.1 hypothetical protein GS8_3120 [Geobacillus stearothermophilus]KOR95255.1 hypothetical protein N231_03015 [Geobacillus stearothermophilus ATCC 12980]NNU99343.1 hypothetical protein [Geobacillus sp. DSP4a]OQP14487.1 hypothetical protein B1693_15180 [Geobacillus zalihae]PJW14452.1 hypothetical